MCSLGWQTHSLDSSRRSAGCRQAPSSRGSVGPTASAGGDSWLTLAAAAATEAGCWHPGAGRCAAARGCRAARAPCGLAPCGCCSDSARKSPNRAQRVVEHWIILPGRRAAERESRRGGLAAGCPAQCCSIGQRQGWRQAAAADGSCAVACYGAGEIRKRGSDGPKQLALKRRIQTKLQNGMPHPLLQADHGCSRVSLRCSW